MEKWKTCPWYIIISKSGRRFWWRLWLQGIWLIYYYRFSLSFQRHNRNTAKPKESQNYTSTHIQSRADAPRMKAFMQPWCKSSHVCWFPGVYINGFAWLTVWVALLTQCDWGGDVSAPCWRRSPFVTILSREMGRQPPVGPESSCLPLCNPTLSMYRHVYSPREHPSRGN